MNISIAMTNIPFLKLDEERVASSLVKELIEAGHKAEIIKYPFACATDQQITDSCMAVWLNEIINTDRVIALNFPAYLVDFPFKKIWKIREFESICDMSNRSKQVLDAVDKIQRFALCKADPDCLFAGSYTIAQNALQKKLPELEVLYSCVFADESIASNTSEGDFLFCANSSSKTDELLIDSFKNTTESIVIVGSENTRALVEKQSLSNRIKVVDNSADIDDLISKSIAVIDVSANQDECVALSNIAFQKGKTIISLRCEFGHNITVDDGNTGFVFDDNSDSFADAIARATRDKKQLFEMSKNGMELLESKGITKDAIVRRLIEQ